MRSTWFSKRALLWHCALIAWVPGCLVAAWWQVHVALAGDDLAYLYSVEWPVFAIFGTVFWWHVIHDDPNTVGMRGLRRLQEQRHDSDEIREDTGVVERDVDAEDEKLSAYNEYLAQLATRDERKTWRKS